MECGRMLLNEPFAVFTFLTMNTGENVYGEHGKREDQKPKMMNSLSLF